MTSQDPNLEGFDPKAFETDLIEKINAAADLNELEALRVEILGKKGVLTLAARQVGLRPADERKAFGETINHIKSAFGEALSLRIQTLSAKKLDARLHAEAQDLSMPARHEQAGKIHPISQVKDELIAIFADMGFTVAEGPDIEDDWHNFSALNIPPEHPARQDQDTFYLPPLEAGDERLILRTQTSPVQIRTMVSQKPPIRVICPGRTFRSDYDQTHTPMFHQLEGLVIEDGIHFGHLKGCLIDLLKRFFEVDDLPIRFRPHYFPFTEPSAEIDIGCSRKDGNLKIGSGDDWLEVLGCGMTHHKVLRNCGLDPNIYQGFAFGMGIDRLTMLKYGVADLRSFFESDTGWLEHYGFHPEEQPGRVHGLSGT